MTEKKLLDMMVTERIQILVQEMKSARTPAERENYRDRPYGRYGAGSVHRRIPGWHPGYECY